LGITGLLTSVLTVLNLTELGIGTSILFALYKPLAENDREQIKSLMHLYKQAYLIIGWVVLAAGMILLPFLPYLVKGNTALVDIRIVFFIYVLDSISSYWFFAYKRTLLEASQQKYIITAWSYLSNTAIAAARICCLLVLKNKPELSYYLYVLIGVFGNIFINLLVNREANKKFPYIQDRNIERLNKEKEKPIIKNVVGVFISKIGGVMITAIDSILISAFIGISTVGVYSNYIMLRTYVVQAIGVVFDSITASVGDYCATESLEKQEKFFDALQFTYFWVYGFCGICLWILFSPFIAGVWLNSSYMLSNLAVTLISINFLLDGLAGAVIKFRDTHGLYWQAKFRYMFSALFNGVLSFALIKPLGVEGVLIGTTCSIIIMLSFDPIIVYKNVFHKSPSKYYLSYLAYLSLIIVTAIFITLITLPFSAYTMFNFCIKLVACLVIPNVLWYVIFRKNSKFEYLKSSIMLIPGYIKKLLRKTEEKRCMEQ
jgi:O-antigen/teichoic acid export membrane protein